MTTTTCAPSRRRRIAARDARRTRLLNLLVRADRGVLTPEDCAQLRTDIESEIAESDTHRRSAGGHQAASIRLRTRIEAAEAAIREVEADRDEALHRFTNRGALEAV